MGKQKLKCYEEDDVAGTIERAGRGNNFYNRFARREERDVKKEYN
jgi:hypothetical protein